MKETSRFKFALAIFVIFAAGCDQCDRGVGVKSDASVQDDGSSQADGSQDAALPERIIEFEISYPDTENIDVGTIDATLIEIKMKNVSSETAMVQDLFLGMYHSPWWNIQNLTLLADGQPRNIITDVPNGSLYLSIHLPANESIEPGQEVTFLVLGDVLDGVCTEVDIRFMEEDANIMGGNTDIPFQLVQIGSTDVLERSIVGNRLNLIHAGSMPPMQDVQQGTADHISLEFYLVSGVPARIQDLDLQIEFPSDPEQHFTNITLYRANGTGWTVLGGPANPIPADCQPDLCTYNMPNDFNIGQCSDDLFRVTVEVAPGAPVDFGFRVRVPGESVVGVDQQQLLIPSSLNMIMGNWQRIVAAP